MLLDLSSRINMFYWQTNRPLSAEQTKEIFMNRHDKLSQDIIKQIVSLGMKKVGFSGKDTVIEKFLSIIMHGSVNSVVPIVLKSGRKIVLRIHPRKVKNGYFWVEKVVTDIARKMGVPTYETIIVDDTQQTVPFDFMITTLVSGRPMSDWDLSNKILNKQLVRETGKYAALIHRIKPEGFGFFVNQLAKTKQSLIGQYDKFQSHIYAALDEDLAYLTNHKVFSVAQLKEIERFFAKNISLMMCRKGSLIHNDIADWNELSDGAVVTGIMDWDECFSGDPLMEVAAYNLFYGEPRLTWFKEGYHQVSTLENNEDKFQLFKLRYLISKMHLRTKRFSIDPSSTMKQNIERGKRAMQEVFDYFRI